MLCVLILGVSSLRGQQVVINEIMYHPQSENPLDEFIELYNRGGVPVDLSGWRFVGGVAFTFPNGTLLGAGSYIVVVPDVAAFRVQHPLVNNVAGGWIGQLSNTGEQIELQNAQGDTVNLVRYADSGDWAVRTRLPDPLRNLPGWEWVALHDGGGRSVELINPAVDNNSGQNWAPSNPSGGTPGAPNSVRQANIAPLILDTLHFPAVPKSTDAITITARLVDEQTNGLLATLYFRNASTTTPPGFTSTPMLDDGAHGDGLAGDGVFGAVLSARPNGTILEFYVQASDGISTRTWPAPAVDGVILQSANALLQVDDSVYAGSQPIVRLVLTETERAALDANSANSDAQMNATLITVDGTETKIRYNCGIRVRGAGSRGRPTKNYRVDVPSDRPWNGLTALNLNSQYIHAQLVGSVIAQKSGLVAANTRAVQVRLNGVNRARSGLPLGGNGDGSGFGSYVLVEPINNEWAGIHFPTDPNGNVYRASSPNHAADLSYQGTNPATYAGRGYSKTSNSSENDWTDLIQLTDVLNNTPDSNYTAAVSQRLNVREWMTYFAVFALMEYSETSLGSGEGDDYALYRGLVDTRFKLVGHDFDTILGQGDTAGNTNESIFVAADVTDQPAVAKFLKWPDFAPVFFEELNRLATGTFAPAQLNPILDQFLGGFVPDSVIAAMKTFAVNRAARVLAQIPMSLRITNTLGVINGYPTAPTPFVSLTGSANAIRTRLVRVNGQPVAWTAWQGAWSATNVALNPGINRVLVQSFDADGVETERGYVDIWYNDLSTQNVSGTVSSDTTWTAAGGPYYVTASLTIPSGVTLVIEPGTTVYFAAGAGLTVTGTGRLLAEGTATQRIRFTRLPGAAGTWANLYFNATTVESRIRNADIEFTGSAAQSLRANNAIVLFEGLAFTNTAVEYCSFDNSSFIVRACDFPSLAGRELIHGIGLPAAGYGIIQSNLFGTTTGLNDIIDFTGGQRPGAILQILDNVFTGASDDELDLDGTDCLIEGNIFLHAHQTVAGGDTSSAISGGQDSGNTSEITIVRNFFYDCDHAALVKEGNFYTFVNNTIVGMTIAAVNFNEPARGLVPGAGARLDGNIIWQTPVLLENYTNATMNVTITRSILPTNFPGAGNLVADPLFADTNLVITAANIRDAFRLRPGSPALEAGANGLDAGALVSAGVSISGVPATFTAATSATLNIGGPGILTYQFRVNNGAWSGETPVSVPIALTSLVNGVYTVDVVGRNDAGVQQTVPASRTWTVDTLTSRLRINEILARNDSAFAHDGGFPDAVELHNAGGSSVNLSGWGLTDDPGQPFKYRLPAVTLGAGQFLVLFADNLTNGSGMHLGFGLDQAGDTLQLFNVATGLVDSITFGTQLPDLSIGRKDDGSWGLTLPTLGSANVARLTGDTRGLKINEWLASGRTLFPDDFVEVFNPSPAPVDLGGLYLSDEPLGWPGRHRVPELTFVAAGGHYLFLADGNAANGANHLSFHLSPDRGAIGLADSASNIIDCVFYAPQTVDSSEGRRPDGASLISVFGPATGTQPTPGAANPGFNGGIVVSNFFANLLPMTSVWRYDRSGANLGTAWRAPAFNDSAWSSGQALLGVENCNCLPFPLNTAFPNYNSSQITYYFRTRFVVSGNLSAATITASTVLDDGAVIYLNGNELRRIRMPGGTIGFQTNANVTVSDATLETFTFPGSSLLTGTNVLAIEVHQLANPTSSDIVWGMALDNAFSVTSSIPARIVLNEVLANNASIVVPGASNGSDYVELFNPSATATSLAGMSLSDDLATPARWTFPAGATLPVGGYLLVQLDGAQAASTNLVTTFNTGFGLGSGGDQIYLFDAPSRGGALLDSVAFGIQTPDLSIGRIPSGSGPWSLNLPTPRGPNIAAALGNPANLRFNEWLANPSGNDEDFFEVFNPGAQPVAIGGLFLTDDLLDRAKYRIPDLSFVGSGDDAFVKFIADGHSDAGADHVSFGLNQDGEALGLFSAAGIRIDSRSFSAQESGVSEGLFPDGATNVVRFRGTATPGRSNLLPLQGIVINEVLTQTEPPFEDAIELHNPTGSPVDISGWYLSDRSGDPKRFRIPNGSVIQPGGFIVFYENQFNPDYSGRPPYFALDSTHGDQVYLFTADGSGTLTGYRTGADFGAAESGVSFGRFRTSIGTDFTALSSRSFGADNPATVQEFRGGLGRTNDYPLVGPVVITEIMYHPPDAGTNDNALDEFIELRNISGAAVPLFQTNFPTATWRLRDAVDFDFAPGVTMAAGTWLLVVAFDPVAQPAVLAAFRAKYGIDSAVPIFGPWQGRLANDGENVELYKAGAPQPLTAPDAGFVPYILVERVKYSDSPPWLSLADGATNGVGYSLQRLSASSYGNDPVNWIAGAPTPGAETGRAAVERPFNASITPPHVVLVGASDTLTVVVNGAPPLTYQWRKDGIDLPGATNASVNLNNIQPTNAGTYSVFIVNPAGAAFASTYLDVSSPPVILTQPQSQATLVGATLVLNVAATGTLPLHYQWLHDGVILPGATNAAIVLSNLQTNDVGGYSVVISNSIGTVTSTVATIAISMLPVIVSQPASTNVLAGSSVVFSVAAVGSPPLRYQWRFNNLNISGATNPTYFISSAQSGNAGGYRVLVTNSVGSVLSSNAVLQVVVPALVSITAIDSVASEPGGDTGRFVIQRSGSTASSLLVNLNVGGSATAGVDYLPLPSSVTIAPGSSTASLTVTALDDFLIEGSETVAVSIGPGAGYAAGLPASASVTILDNDNLPPVVSITNPVNGAVITAPANIVVGVSAVDIGGSIAHVQIVQDETNILGDFVSPPYVVIWTNPAPAHYTLRAIAVDDLGTTSVSEPVSFILNNPPSISLTNPVNGSVYLDPAAFILGAVTADTDGSVTNVEFYSGTTLLGSFAGPPYRLALTNLPTGDYSFTARASDDLGAVTISAQANVRVSLASPGFSDDFAMRNVLTGFTNFVMGNSSGYSREAGEPRHASRFGDHSAWVVWTAPASGTCVIDTFGSGFDTVLAVYTNNPPGIAAVTNLVAVTFNDDADSRTVLSRVAFVASQGVSYQIAVDAYAAGQGGPILLHLALPDPAPRVTQNPQSQIVDQGANVSFTVAVSGAAPFGYQWRFNGSDIPGAIQSSLSRPGVQPVSAGTYSVVISNASGSITSAPASLIVRAAPAITMMPRPLVLNVGETANFDVTANGFAPLTYQWRFNNSPIAGATNPAFVRSNIQFTNGGAYSVTVLNSVGVASSVPVELLIRPELVSGRLLTNGTFRATYNGTPGRAYVLERSSNFTNWNSVITNSSPVVQGQLNDTGASGAPFRFYRLRVGP
ncbi:MAG: hypothetical protein QOF48_2539 [Verrucomicrobiota bacterium]